MGLFSSKTIYTVETSTSRVIEDDRTSDVLQRSMIEAIIGDDDIARVLVNNISTSVGHRVEKMFKFVEKDYRKGLMRSMVTTNRGQLGAIRSRVESATGHTGLEIVYAQLAPLNYNHLAYQKLVAKHRYNPVSNELAGLSASLGGQVFLVDFMVLVPQTIYNDAEQAGTLRAFDQGPSSGYTPRRPMRDLSPFALAPETLVAEDRSDIVVVAEWLRRADDGTLTSGEISIPLSEPNNDLEVFQIKYRYQGSLYYWSYTHREGSIPALDALYDVPVTAKASYLPVIYFRRDHNNLSHSSRKDGSEYKAAEEALDILGINYAEMGKAIHDNPDIGDVRNAYVMFGAAMNSNDQAVRRYLYEYFLDMLIEASDLDLPMGSGFGYGVLGRLNNEDTGRISVRMTPNQNLGEHQIGANMTLSVRSVGSRIGGGKLGAVGTYHLSRTSSSYTYSYRATVRTGSNGEMGFETRQRTRSYPVLRIRYQATKSTYHEVRVNDPVLRHHIDGSGRGTNNGLGDPDLLIPIDRERIRGWGVKDKEMLLQKSLHLVFNVRDKQKVKWYQSTFFKVLLIVAAVVIAVFSGQWQMVALAFATGGIVAAAWVIVVAIVKSLALKFAFKVIAKELGAEFALYLAVAMAIYGGYTSFKAGSVQGAPWGEELLMAAGGLGKAAGEQFGIELEGLASEYDDLLGIEEEREAELERARSLLNTNSHALNPLNFILGESPENFYQRTVHSGNIGTLGFEAIHSYVDISLHLPGT